jgi:hydrogenase nickel incorporation protein HypB
MCATCGCSSTSEAQERPHAHGHDHGHEHDHPHGHQHEHDHAARGRAPDDRPAAIHRLEEQVLAKNDRIAQRTRSWLADRRVLALNLVSSPGAGKTTVLEKAIPALRGEGEVAVIEGDQETALDADRIRETGAPAVQVNTGTGCHLDAAMVADALPRLQLPSAAILFIENVGNLVCPALFDLGEQAKVVVISVTEGEDKPLKYPHMFRASRLVLLNKIDLAPHVAFDRARFDAALEEVNPRARVFPISATRGDGLEAWHDWLRAERRQVAR